MICEVVINNISRFTDSLFHYLVPEDLESKIKVGMRIKVPFGKGNKSYEGYVMGFANKADTPNLKEIIQIIEDFSYFDENMASLIKYLHHRYFSLYSDIIKAVLPRGVSARYEMVATLIEKDPEVLKSHTKNSLIREQIAELLLRNREMSYTDISSELGRKNIMPSMKYFLSKGIVEVKEVKIQRMDDKTKTFVSLNVSVPEAFEIIDRISKRAKKRALVLEILTEVDSISMSDLLEEADTGRETVNALFKDGYVDIYQAEVLDEKLCIIDEDKPHYHLTDEQTRAYDAIRESIDNDLSKTFLIRGVTGSGKTEVYLRLIDRCIESGKQAIFLVPEIALTPQMVRQVSCYFGDQVAVMHSMLTLRERYDEWKRIKKGIARVVVGARSAIFSPCEDLGLIIIDEEHESTYKSETSPRYHTLEVARYRAKFENATLVLASATPSLESFKLAKDGVYELLEMKNRINSSPLPEVEIVDMREELTEGNRSVFSNVLKSEIAKNLKDKKQTMLFLNKRGFSSFVSCRSCGYVAECPNCNIPLNYHKVSESLICHFCDYKEPKKTVCPKCGSTHIRHFGIGTQKVCDEISSLFPEARVLRMDADTTLSPHSHEVILDRFRKGEADILVGTQMIAKGLDFENVTLVGVVAADISLFMNDFRAGEKTFSLITQVVGRAGRGKYPGRAVIQTYDPDNQILDFSKNQDYEGFYEEEISLRSLMWYPPYCEIININSSSESDYQARKTLLKLRDELIKELSLCKLNSQVTVMSVTKAPMHRVNSRYRYRFIIKMKYSKTVYNIIHKVLESQYKTAGNSTLTVDVNPINMY
ncbi:MAG: primosomal protein N' [Ruminococcaceae bacterium]|nr:primosomal protein N' [Oscillospiraceae bacterium]